MSILPIVFVVVCSVSIGVFAYAEPAKDSPVKKDTPLQQRRAKCQKTEPKTLKIVEPVEVKDAFYAKDGGSHTITLVDKKNVTHEFVIRKSAFGTFDIAEGPAKNGDTPLESGGTEEQELYGVLLRWGDKQPKKAELLDKTSDSLEDSTLRGVQGMLIRLDDRIGIKLESKAKE